MKLYSAALEKLIIKLVTTLDEDKAFYTLSKLTVADFNYEPALECYKRIKVLLKNQNAIPQYVEVINDPAISETTRTLFTNFTKTKAVKDIAALDRIINQLGTFRKARELFKVSNNTISKLKEEKVDLDKLILDMNDGLTRARMNREDAIELVHIGDGNNSGALVESLLSNDTSLRGIPTGFKTWDDVNNVVPFGSCFIIAATTSGLKTTLALQLSRNFTEYGARCAFVSLEMTKEEIMQRRMCNLSRISMTKITNPRTMTPAEKKKVGETYKSYVNRAKKKGAVETFIHPKGEVTDDEIIFKVSSLNYKVLFIDYVGLLKGTGGDDQWRVLGDIVRKLKLWAVANNKIVVILAQLDNTTNAIRYSRAMQEHANLMWSWNRDQKAKETHILSIKQDKARNQRDFPFHLKEEADFMTICDLPTGHEVPSATQPPSDSSGRGGRGRPPAKEKPPTKRDDSYLDDIQIS